MKIPRICISWAESWFALRDFLGDTILLGDFWVDRLPSIAQTFPLMLGLIRLFACFGLFLFADPVIGWPIVSVGILSFGIGYLSLSFYIKRFFRDFPKLVEKAHTLPKFRRNQVIALFLAHQKLPTERILK